MQEEKKKILQSVQEGKMTAEEAFRYFRRIRESGSGKRKERTTVEK